MAQDHSLLTNTLLPRFRRPSTQQVRSKGYAIDAQNASGSNTRDLRAATALVWTNGVRATAGTLFRHRLWRAMMRIDASYVKRPNVGDLAAFNALAWAGGFTLENPLLHAKKRVVLHVGRKMTIPAKS